MHLRTGVIALLLGSSNFVIGAETPKTDFKKVEQLVIVYSPAEDWNGSFDNYVESLSDLRDAAKEKGIVLRLINVDDYRGQGPDKLREVIRTVSSERGSVVIAATHGGMVQANAAHPNNPDFDTVLSFLGGMRVSHVAPSLNHENVAAFVVEACHANNPNLKKMFPEAVSCGSSQFDKEGNRDTGQVVRGALTDAIRAGSVEDLGEFLKKNVLEKAQKLAPADQARIIDPGNPEAVPVNYSKAIPVEFKGTGFAVLDEKNDNITPCTFSYKRGSSDQDPEIYFGARPASAGGARIVSKTFFPNEAVQEGRFEDLFINNEELTMYQMFIYPKGARAHGTYMRSNPGVRFTCHKDGTWELREPEKCTGLSVPKENCYEKIKEHFDSKNSNYKFDQKGIVATCENYSKSMAVYAQRGMKVSIKNYCFHDCVLTGAGGIAPLSTIPLGACSKFNNGSSCAPAVSGKGSLSYNHDGECFQKDFNPCVDQSGKTVSAGSCLQPKLVYPRPPDCTGEESYFESFANFPIEGAHFKCVGSKAVVPDKDCCVKNRGVWQEGSIPLIPPKPDSIDPAEIETHWSSYIQASSANAHSHCTRKVTEPGGEQSRSRMHRR